MLDFDTYYPLDLSLMNPSSKIPSDPLYGQFEFRDHDQYNSSSSSIQTPQSIEDELFGKISDYESSPLSSPAMDSNYVNNEMGNCNCSPYEHPYAYHNMSYQELKPDYPAYPTPTSFCEYLASPVLPQEELTAPIFVTGPTPMKYEGYTYPIPPAVHQVMPIRTVKAPLPDVRNIPKTGYKPWSSIHDPKSSHDWAANKENQRRFAWSQELHEQFVQAYESLGDNATPKKIMIAMRAAGANMEGITRLKVASHFQKYLQKIGKKGQKKSSLPTIFPTFNKDTVNIQSHPASNESKHSQILNQQKPPQQVNRPPPSA